MVFLQSLYLVLISISSSRLFVMTMMMNLVFAGPTGLTLRLIHSDSPESPLYPARRNLTQLEKMERAFQQTEAREQQLIAASMNSWVRNNNNNSNSKRSSSFMNTVRPGVYFSGSYYMVTLGIGTFRIPSPPPQPSLPFKEYFFVLDTGSDLLWLQCEECDICFPQDAPPFPWKASSTYHPLPCNSGNSFCKYNFCLEDSCGYNLTYASGPSTVGVLATEKLTVKADNGLKEEIDGFVFGCGKTQKDFPFGQRDPGQNQVVGVLGLGGGKESFLRQLGDRGQMKFEYCLELLTHDGPVADTSLRFGSDTKIIVGGGPAVQSTQTLPVRGQTLYYVIMYGISVDRTRIPYDNDIDIFNSKKDGTGGSVFDSGTPWTLLSTQVYDPLKDYLIGYFKAMNIRTCDPGERTLYELCFERPNVFFDRFPTITFHFSGGSFEIDPRVAFYMEAHVFCLNILRSRAKYPFSVLFGAIQQANHRVLYDVGKSQISWSKEECVSGS